MERTRRAARAAWAACFSRRAAAICATLRRARTTVIELSLAVDADGRATGIELRPGAPGAAPLTGCLEPYRVQRFPPPRGGGTVLIQLRYLVGCGP